MYIIHMYVVKLEIWKSLAKIRVILILSLRIRERERKQKLMKRKALESKKKRIKFKRGTSLKHRQNFKYNIIITKQMQSTRYKAPWEPSNRKRKSPFTTHYTNVKRIVTPSANLQTGRTRHVNRSIKIKKIIKSFLIDEQNYTVLYTTAVEYKLSSFTWAFVKTA